MFGDPTEWDVKILVHEATVFRNYAQTKHLAALSKCFAQPASPYSASDAAPVTYNLDVKMVRSKLVFAANDLNICTVSARKYVFTCCGVFLAECCDFGSWDAGSGIWGLEFEI